VTWHRLQRKDEKGLFKNNTSNTNIKMEFQHLKMTCERDAVERGGGGMTTSICKEQN
jgi:hypothetical protein